MAKVRTDDQDEAPGATLATVLQTLEANADARATAAAAGADLGGLIRHARATANELAILLTEVAKFAGGDKALVAIAEQLRT
jgi:hypothetical protein